MKDLTERLLDVLEEAYYKDHILKEFSSHLTDGNNVFMDYIIQEIEIALVQSLEGCRENWVYLITDEQDVFHKYQKREINKEDIVREIRYVVYFGFEGEACK